MEIVVVGCKGFGKVHLRSIGGADVSIVERNDTVANNVMMEYRIKHRYASFDEALRSDADVIDLVVPHNLHKDLSIQAMEAGKNVIVEKPIATTLEDADSMISASARYNVKFMVAEQFFFDPSVREAMHLINSGALGKLGTIVVRDQRYYGNQGWRNESGAMGGGSLIDGGIHYIDTMLNLGGSYKKVHSASFHLGSVIQGEDNAMAMFHFQNGAIGLFYYSWAYRNPPILPGIEIVGSDSSLYEDVASRSTVNFKDTKRRTAFGDLILNGKNIGVKMYDIFEREFSEFLDAVRYDTHVPFDPKLARRDLAAVLDIYNENTS